MKREERKEHVNNNNAAIMHFIIKTIRRQRTIMNSIIARLTWRPRKMMMLIMLPLCTLLLDRFQAKDDDEYKDDDE